MLLVSTVAAFLALLITENLARKNKLGMENSRKAAHIIIALTIATWPFFVGMKSIGFLGLAFVAAAWAIKKPSLFKHARKVERTSWGEYFFGIGVAGSAFINPADWIFVAAMLHMGVADSAGALVGKKKGKHKYKVFGQVKSIEGSLAFFTASVLITAFVVLIAPTSLDTVWPIIIWLPFIATFLEAVTPYGLDNAVLPITVTVLLKFLQP